MARRWIAAPGFAWDALYTIARREALLPLLCDIVRERNVVPVEWEDRWRAHYASSMKRNWRLLAELEDVVVTLTDAGITPILLKGAALTQTVYADPALRPMTDLDLLVQREQVADALRVLAAQGYAPAQPGAPVGLALEFE
ncbi:MAG: nucleotidyltransferase family protein, partial [Anaerolineae bacterium]|nr:nucleotidyltransferase family protein [Anaerolineae bacterium]